MTADIIKRAVNALRNKKDIDTYTVSDSIKSRVMSRKMTAKEINGYYKRAKG